MIISALVARRFVRNHNHAVISAVRTSSTSASSISSNVSASQAGSNWQYLRLVPIVLASSAAGFAMGRHSLPNEEEDKHLHLPNGLPRTCCDQQEMTEKQKELFQTLKRIVGKENVLDGREETTQTSPYLKGARLGKGSALCIVKPTKLKQLVEIVRAVVEADCVVLVQGQNTGLVRSLEFRL